MRVKPAVFLLREPEPGSSLDFTSAPAAGEENRVRSPAAAFGGNCSATLGSIELTNEEVNHLAISLFSNRTQDGFHETRGYLGKKKRKWPQQCVCMGFYIHYAIITVLTYCWVPVCL